MNRMALVAIVSLTIATIINSVSVFITNVGSIGDLHEAQAVIAKRVNDLEAAEAALTTDVFRLIGKELRRRDDMNKPWWEARDYWEADPRNPLWSGGGWNVITTEEALRTQSVTVSKDSGQGTGVFSAGTPVPRLWLGDDDCTEEGQP